MEDINDLPVRYQLSPREIAPPRVKKPTKKELYPQLTDYAKRAITILDNDVFEKLWKIHQELLEARRKVSELEKQYDMIRQEATQIPGIANSVKQVYEWLAKRSSEVNEFINIAYQYKGRLGDFLISFAREVVKEQPSEKLLDPKKTEDFITKAKELGLITDTVVDMVMKEIEEANKAIEDGRKVVADIRTMYIWKPRETDTPHLAKKADLEGVWNKIKDGVISFVRSISQWLGLVESNDELINQNLQKALDLLSEEEVELGDLVYARGALAKVVGKKKDDVVVRYFSSNINELLNKNAVLKVRQFPVVKMESLSCVKVGGLKIEGDELDDVLERVAQELYKYGFNDDDVVDILDTMMTDFEEKGYSERIYYIRTSADDSKVVLVGDTDYVEVDETGMVTVWDKETGKKVEEKKVDSKEKGVIDYGNRGYKPLK